MLLLCCCAKVHSSQLTSLVLLMSDFQILSADFNATTVEVRALTQAAKDRLGFCAISVSIRKSALPQWVAMMEAEGFTVA